MDADVAEDVRAIGKIDAVQKILEVVCRFTGLGFSAVARVTETRWIACAVRDEIAFGLTPSVANHGPTIPPRTIDRRPGGDLPVDRSASITRPGHRHRDDLLAPGRICMVRLGDRVHSQPI